MRPPDHDESLIRELVLAFSVAVAREVPHEIAALMCADEAQSFLDTVSDPDGDDPADPVDGPPVEVTEVGVFGDVALVRFVRSAEAGDLYLRREDGRWTVCADAEDDISLEQRAPRADAVPAPDGVHDLRRRPLGSLSVGDVRVLLEHRVDVDVLLPRAVLRLQSDPLVSAGLFPGDLLVTALRVDPAWWARDPVALARMNIAVDTVRGMGDLAGHGAPHGEIATLAADFLATRPGWDRPPGG